MADDEQSRRIIAARLALRERWLGRMKATPGVADDRPQGTGPLNRHGMPQVPTGQHVTTKWPVLDLGERPDVSKDTWRLEVDGAVATPLSLDFAALLRLPQVQVEADFHCVTTWSLLDSRWGGVALSTVAAAAGLAPDATHVLTHGLDGYTTNLSLDEALKDDVLLVHTWNGQPLPYEHGGPVRVITPQLYAWKGAKWICRLEFLTHDVLGFWEERGYSNTAHPWRDDRYS